MKQVQTQIHSAIYKALLAAKLSAQIAGISVLAFASTYSASASQGSGSHGGGTFVCQDMSSGQIFSAESQDLWEATHFQGLSLDIQGIDEVTRSRNAVARILPLQPELFDRVNKALNVILEKRQIKEVAIEEVGDNKRKFSKDSCDQGVPRFVYAAVYSDKSATPDFHPKDDELIYSKKIWDLMKVDDQAALNVHEAVYKVMRTYYRDADSTRTRLIVGYLFSKASDEILAKVLPTLEFNPNGDQSYDEKISEVLERFERAETPKLKPGRHNEMRVCRIFDRRAVIPREVPTQVLEFNFNREGQLNRIYEDTYVDAKDWRSWMKTRMPFVKRDSALVGFQFDRALYGAIQFFAYGIKLREESNGDLILLRYGVKSTCGSFSPCEENDFQLEGDPTRVAFCPKP